MYKIRTEFSFEAAHKLDLPYESLCRRLHGHSYLCAVTIAATRLNAERMIVDFRQLKAIIKEVVEDKLDHCYLNDIFDGNTTAEFMSKWICDTINDALKTTGIDARCVCVELNETAKNKAIWEEE